jgi:hypothetical protein
VKYYYLRSIHADTCTSQLGSLEVLEFDYQDARKRVDYPSGLCGGNAAQLRERVRVARHVLEGNSFKKKTKWWKVDKMIQYDAS